MPLLVDFVAEFGAFSCAAVRCGNLVQLLAVKALMQEGAAQYDRVLNT